MTDRTPVPAVTSAPARPDTAAIDDLLRRLDESVAIHQRRRRLAKTIRTWRSAELEVGNDCARSAAAAYTRVLVEMGEDAGPPPGTRVHITHCASRAGLVGDEGETVGPLSDGIAVGVRVHGLGMFAEHRVVAVQGWEVLG